jgi:release factor glutamine methyltransferase
VLTTARRRVRLAALFALALAAPCGAEPAFKGTPVAPSMLDGRTLVLADLGEAFPELDGTASVVISNPPYVPDAAIPRDPEVRMFDPSMALYGGEDGLDVGRVLSSRALALLRPGGLLVIEHGELQGASIRELLTADGWRAAATHRDLTLRDRTTTALRP